MECKKNEFESFRNILTNTAIDAPLHVRLFGICFPDLEAFEKEVDTLKKTYRKEVCSASINQGDLSFKCYDCGRNNEFHIYCESCFLHSEHTGHRVMYSCERGGCCDCGDDGAIDFEGFCSRHKGYAGIDKNIRLKAQKWLRDGMSSYFRLGMDFMVQEWERIIEMENIGMEDAMDIEIDENHGYVKLKGIENEEKQQEKDIKKVDKQEKPTAMDLKKRLNEFCSGFFEKIIQICMDNLCLTFVLSDLMVMTEKNYGFKHDCENNESLTLGPLKKNCKCSYLELIFRFNELIEEKVQDGLEKLFFNLFSDIEFKKHLVIVYSKMFNFMISFFKRPDGKIKTYVSKMRPVYTQFFSEELMDLFLKNNFMENALLKTKQLLPLMSNPSFEALYDKFLELYNIFYFISERKASIRKRLFSTDLLERLLLALFCKSEESFVSLEQQKLILHIQKLSLNLFEEYLHHFLEKLPLEDFNARMIKLLQFITENKETFFLNNEEFSARCQQNHVCFIHENSSRAVASILSHLLIANQNISFIKKMIGFLDEKLFSFLISRSMEVIALYNAQIRRKQSEFPSVPIFNSTKILLQGFFSSQITNSLDYHIFLVQILSIIVNNAILHSFLKNFSSDMNFFESLAKVMTNEVSVLNVSPLIKIEGLDFRNGVLKGILANFLVIFPKMSYPQIKAKLQKFILNKHTEIKDHLLKIADLRPDSKDFKLKIPFEDVYEPYFWGNLDEIGSRYMDSLRDAAKRVPKMDFLLGVPAIYEQNPLISSFIKRISGVTMIWELILKHLGTTQPEMNDPIRHLLKIMGLILEYGLGEGETQAFIKTHVNTLSKFLKDLRERKEFEEIWGSLTVLLGKLNVINEGKWEEENGDKIADEKEKKDARKRAIMAQYAQKQKAFIEKNKEHIGEMGESNKNDNVQTLSNLECYICHEMKEDPSEIFEYSASISSDSLHNYYYMEREKTPFIFQEKILNRERFLIISCGHQVHHSCLQAFLKNKKTVNDYGFHNNDGNELKFKCSCCKFSCNISVPIISSFCNQKTSICLENFAWNAVPKNQKDALNQIFLLLSIAENTKESVLQYEKAFLARQSVDQFINKTMMNVINIKNDSFHEYYLFEVLLESLVFYSEEAFSEGLDYFLKKRMLINRNIFLITKDIFWSNADLPSFPEFVNEFREAIMKDVEKILFLEENPVYFLRNVDILLAKVVWKLAILLPFGSESHRVIGMIARIFINKLIVVFSYFLLKAEKDIAPSLKDILKGFEDYDFRIKVLSFLGPYFHLVSSLFFVVFNFEWKVVEEKLRTNIETEHEILVLSGFFGSLFGISLEVMGVFAEEWVMTLEKLDSIQEKVLHSEILKNPGLKFSLGRISDEFQKFYTKYIGKKCENCKDYPRIMKGDLYVCLICDTVLCNSYCFQKPKSVGNLTKHVMENHCNKGFFVNLIETRVLWIDIPTVFFEDFLFTDSLGQNMTRKSINWEDFRLNKSRLEKLRSLLVRREVSQEIYYHLIRDPKNVVFTDQI